MQDAAIDVKALEGIQIDWSRTKNTVDLLRHTYNQGRTKDKFTMTTRLIAIAVLSLANRTLTTMKQKNLYRLDKIVQDANEDIKIETYYHQLQVMLLNKETREFWDGLEVKSQHATIRRHLKIMQAVGVISSMKNISAIDGSACHLGRKIVISVPQTCAKIEKIDPLKINKLSPVTKKSFQYSSVLNTKENKRKEKGDCHSDQNLIIVNSSEEQNDTQITAVEKGLNICAQHQENSSKRLNICAQHQENSSKGLNLCAQHQENSSKEPPSPLQIGSVADDICHQAMAAKSTVLAVTQPADVRNYLNKTMQVKFNNQLHDDRASRVNILYYLMMQFVFKGKYMSVESIAKAQLNLCLLLDYVIGKYRLSEDDAYQLVKNSIAYVSEQTTKGNFTAILHPITYLATDMVDGEFRITKGCLRIVIDRYYEKLKRYANAKKFNDQYRKMNLLKLDTQKRCERIFEGWKSEKFTIRQTKQYITVMEQSLYDSCAKGAISEAFYHELLGIIRFTFSQIP